MSENEMGDVKQNRITPGILGVCDPGKLLQKLAEEHGQKAQQSALNALAHRLYDQCKSIEALCSELLTLAESQPAQPKTEPEPITYSQLEQYLHILAGKFDFFDPGPREVKWCHDLVKSYPAESVFKAFQNLLASQMTGRFSVGEFCYQVQRVNREANAGR